MIRESLASHHTHTDFNQVFREAHDHGLDHARQRTEVFLQTLALSRVYQMRTDQLCMHLSTLCQEQTFKYAPSIFKAVTFLSSLSDAGMLWHLMLLKVGSLHAKIRKINFSPQRWNCYSQGLSYDTETTQ